jgi:2-polyprenyl-6-methoxyphenol hydroxylase-like FAD-dependent oxidoreductase
MKRVLIAGAGPAGLAHAIALRQSGIHVTLIERVSRARTETDAGGAYELSSRALRALASLGAREGVERRGSLVKGFELRAGSGRVLQQVDFERERLRIVGITRSALVRALWKRLDELGAELREGCTITRVTEQGVDLSTGEALAADLIVAADGVHSALRRLVFSDVPAIDLGIGAWWGAARGSVLEAGHASGVVVPGLSMVIAQGPEERVSWTVCSSLEGVTIDQLAERLPEQARQLVLERTHVAQTRLFEQRPLTSWLAKRVLLVGDAAHGMSPFLGLGANLALEDGVEAAREFLEDRVEAWSRARAREVNPLISQARQLARMMHWRSGLAHGAWRAVTAMIPNAVVLRELRSRHAE